MEMENYQQKVQQINQELDKIAETKTFFGKTTNYQIDQEWVNTLIDCSFDWNPKAEKFLNKQLHMAIPAKDIVNKTLWPSPKEFKEDFSQTYKLYQENPQDFIQLANSTKLFPIRSKLYSVILYILFASLALGWLVVGWSLWFKTITLIGSGYFISQLLLDKLHFSNAPLAIIIPLSYIYFNGYNHLAMVLLIAMSLMYLIDRIIPPPINTDTFYKMSKLK